MRHNYQGAFTALVTPFTENNEIDTLAPCRLVQLQIAGGINGLVPCGTTGEVSTPSALEYEQVIRTVVDEAADKLPVIAGAPSNPIALSGNDKLTLPILAVNGKGSISVMSNEIPKQFTDIVRAAMNGDWTLARKIYYQRFDLMEANFIETNPTSVKTALAGMGKINEIFRLPITSMKKDNSKNS